MDSRFPGTADSEPTAQTNAGPGDVRVAPAEQSPMAGAGPTGPLDRPAEDDMAGEPASAGPLDRSAASGGQEVADAFPGRAESSAEPEVEQPTTRSQAGTDAEPAGDAAATYPAGETSGMRSYPAAETAGTATRQDTAAEPSTYPADGTTAAETRPGTETAAGTYLADDSGAAETRPGTYPAAGAYPAGDTTATGTYRGGEAAGAGIDPGAETAGMVSDIDGRPAEHGTATAGHSPRAGATRQSAPGGADADTPLMADAARLRQRWQDIQATFVDDPRGSVVRAASLAEEVADSLATTAHERARGLRGTWDDGDQADTERLRNALRNYRMLIDRISAV